MIPPPTSLFSSALARGDGSRADSPPGERPATPPGAHPRSAGRGDPEGGPSGRLRVRVRYAETDQMGLVYHAHILVWMEVGRTELLRVLGHPYDELERGGLFFAVSRVSCRFTGAARYGDEVLVETWIAGVRSRDVRFDYRLSRAGGGAVAEASATVVALGRDGKPRRIPPRLLESLRAAGAAARPSGREVVLT